MASSPAAAKILVLRQLLAERFPAAAPLPPEEALLTGLPALDAIGLPRAALTEIVPATSGSSLALCLYGLLHAALRQGLRVALIDGKDAFAPTALPQAELNRLLWVRCAAAWEAIKAADLAVRDGNVPLVVLLLALNRAEELRRIPATVWHRLHVLAEKSAVALVAFTPQAQIGGARLRLAVEGAFPLEELEARREELLPRQRLRVERRRAGRREEDDDVRRAICA